MCEYEYLHALVSLCVPMSVPARAPLQQGNTVLGNVSVLVCVHYDCTV